VNKGTDTPKEVTEQHQHGASRHQAIFSIDFGTWEKLIAAFNIKEPLIPHRQEDNQTQVGGRGWYG
jgi:non-structural maintenance of chromosomes element 4